MPTTTFFRLLDFEAEEKPSKLLECIRAVRQHRHDGGYDTPMVYERQCASLADIPGSPIAYWVSDRLRSFFSTLPTMAEMGATTKCGLGTLDDFRFLRLWWTTTSRGWVPFPKGGSFSLWYSSVPLALNWNTNAPDGEELKTFVEDRVGSASRKIQAQAYYFRAGLTWPRRTQRGLNLRAMPGDCIFADKGPAAFVGSDNPKTLLALLAIANSLTFRYLVELQMAFGSYEVGVIQRTPLPELATADRDELAAHARRAWSLRRWLDSVNEVSHAFVLPAGLIESVIEFDPASIRLQIRDIEGRVNDLAFRLYGIGEDDRSEIESSFSIVEARREPGPGGADDEDDDGHVEDEDIQAGVPLPPNLSWLVGVSFGRFDVRLATGDRPVPPEPEPFDPLPAQSPGMWPADEERPAPPPDILVDDPGHDRDISSQVAAVAALVNVPEPDDLRRWLAHEFFPLHIKMYSKSRRKAPIYWQLATPSASYSVWLYIHAFSRDTMFRVQNNYVLPKLRLEESRLETMEHEAGANATAAQRRAVAEQESFVAELRSFLDEVKRVAPLWDPDPNDGVIINFAPLWRLVPHYRAWQKELKATWEALYEGKYDWSRLAMRFWPERAVPKCVADRSLAIAHGFQDILWLQGLDGRWKKRATPTRPVSELIAERSSDAVQAALASLLNAPAVVGGRKGRRRSNAGTTDTGGH